MTKTIKDLIKFNIEIEILKKTQAELNQKTHRKAIQLEQVKQKREYRMLKICIRRREKKHKY